MSIFDRAKDIVLDELSRFKYLYSDSIEPSAFDWRRNPLADTAECIVRRLAEEGLLILDAPEEDDIPDHESGINWPAVTALDHVATLIEWMNTGIEPLIVKTMPFGDIDNGPSFGVNYYLRIGLDIDPDVAAKALWDYLTRNYEDDFQEYVRSTVSTIADDGFKLVQVIVYIKWGDGHRSVVSS